MINHGSFVAEWLRQRTGDLKIPGSNPATVRCRGEAYTIEITKIVAGDHSKGHSPWLESDTSWGKDSISCKPKALSMIPILDIQLQCNLGPTVTI